MEKTVSIEIPEDLAEMLSEREDILPEILRLGLRQLKVQEALLLYDQGVISLARAAELAGLSLQEMVMQARARGIQPKWSDAMLEDDLA